MNIVFAMLCRLMLQYRYIRLYYRSKMYSGCVQASFTWIMWHICTVRTWLWFAANDKAEINALCSAEWEIKTSFYKVTSSVQREVTWIHQLYCKSLCHPWSLAPFLYDNLLVNLCSCCWCAPQPDAAPAPRGEKQAQPQNRLNNVLPAATCAQYNKWTSAAFSSFLCLCLLLLPIE